MSDRHRNRSACLPSLTRPSNQQLGALVVAVAMQGKAARPLLCAALLPLLRAYYEGQVQAGRADSQHLDGLVRLALSAIYQRCAQFDPAQPTRAWVLQIARDALLEHLAAGAAEPRLSRAV